MSIYVALNRDVKEKLIALSRQERRRPADTAALLVEEGLRRAERERAEPTPLCRPVAPTAA